MLNFTPITRSAAWVLASVSNHKPYNTQGLSYRVMATKALYLAWGKYSHKLS